MSVPTKRLDYAIARKVVARRKQRFVAPAAFNVLSRDAALLLAKHHERLSFPGLRGISPRVAAALATLDGTLVLDGIVSLTTSVALALAGHTGRLVMRRLARVDTESLEALAGHRRVVTLPALRPLPDDDRRQRMILAGHGTLRYDDRVIDVSHNTDFTGYRWCRAPR